MSTENTITITLDDVLGPGGLEGAWDAMVGKLTARVESKFIHSDAGKSFHSVCMDAINKAVQAKIEERIEAMMNSPIQETDNYGNPKGDPTTFTAMIGDAVAGAMTRKVNIYGEFKRDGQQTLLQYALQKVAQGQLRNAVLAEVKKVNASAKEAVAKEVARAIANAIR